MVNITLKEVKMCKTAKQHDKNQSENINDSVLPINRTYILHKHCFLETPYSYGTWYTLDIA